MLFIAETFLGGCISKVINDGKDYTWAKIKSVINDKNDRNLSTRIYRVIEKALIKVTDKKFKDIDVLYDAIEKIFIEFKDNGDSIESVKCGLNVLGTDVSDQRCEDFLERFYEGIRQDDDLYKTVILDLEQKGIKISQEEFQKLNEKIDRNHIELIKNMDSINENLNKCNSINGENINNRNSVFKNNKKQDYIKIWNSKMFLHTGNDKNPMTLADAFIMPDYEMHKAIPRMDYFYFDTLDVIIKEFAEYEKTSTMLITGVPGIGKSSITSWIANEYKDDDRFIILRFRDWDSEELQKGLLRAICNTLGCKNKDLKYKILILDGFDEMKSLDIRDRLLNAFFNDIKDRNNFKCIITSRPAYIDSSHFQNVIELKEFNIDKVDAFYRSIKGSGLTGREKIESNLEVLGIPVILYMAIMSGVDINEQYTKPELYNKIFAEKGGIFDRFYDGENEYSEGSQIMRNPENIKKYLVFLRVVAFMMFQNNKLNLKKEDCKVPELEFQEDTVSILEFPIKHLFENVKTNVEFIHKSIYEYFVSEYIFTLMYDEISEDASIEKLSGIFGDAFNESILSKEIIEFLKYRVDKGKMSTVFDTINKTFRLMLKDGMTYYTKQCYKNVIKCEMNVFANMLEILHLWEDNFLILDYFFVDFLRYNKIHQLNLRRIKVNASSENSNKQLKLVKGQYLGDVYLVRADLEDAILNRADLEGANLKKANLRSAKLCESNLKEADLRGADIEGAQLEFANLSKAQLKNVNLFGADLRCANLTDADLTDALLDQSQWYASDVRKIFPQLKATKFTYIVVVDRKKKKLYKNELFPDINSPIDSGGSLFLNSELRKSLEEVGIDLLDFSLMYDDEKIEVLKDAGLDPFDFDMF